MRRDITCPACGRVVEHYKNPLPAADIIVAVGDKVVLIRRLNYPPGWAIPGGFIEYGEKAEDAAVREIREETGMEVANLRLFQVRSDPKRDPRFHTITVVYTADGSGTPRPGDDAKEAGLFGPDELPAPLAFDHAEILADYFRDRAGRR